MTISPRKTERYLYNPQDKRIKIDAYFRLLNQNLKQTRGIKITRYSLDFDGGGRTLTEVSSARKSGRRNVVLTAGFHPGPEPQSIICTLSFINQIFCYAQEKNVGLVCFPLVNELGAINGTRYGDGDPPKGIANNDAIRFDGDKKKDFLKQDRPRENIKWSLAKDLGVILPPETRKLVEILSPILKRDQVTGFIDYHNDYREPGYTPPSGTYAFSYGDQKNLYPVFDAIKKKGGTVLKDGKQVWGVNDLYVPIRGGQVNNQHDASFINWAYLSGVPICVTPEVTTDTSIQTTTQIYWYWATFAISMAAGENTEKWLQSANRLKIRP